MATVSAGSSQPLALGGHTPIACDLGTSANRIIRAAIAEEGGISTGVDSAIRAMARPGVKVFHNALFDLSRLWEAGIEVVPPIFDTMLAFHFLYPYLPKSLETVASLYLDVERWKDGDKDESVKWDAQVTFLLYHHLRDELAVTEQLPCFEAMMRALPILVETGLNYQIPYLDDRGGLGCEPVAILPAAGYVTVSGRYQSDEALLAIAAQLSSCDGPLRGLAYPVGARLEQADAWARVVFGRAEKGGPPHREHRPDDPVGSPVDEPHHADLPPGRRKGGLRDEPHALRPREVRAFKAANAPLLSWVEQAGTEAQERGHATNFYGRRLECRSWGRKRIARWLCESTLNDRLWSTLPITNVMIRELGGKIVAVTLTEVVATVPESQATEASRILGMLGAGNAASGTVRESGSA